MRILSDHDVAGSYVDALGVAEGVTVDRAVDLFGEKVPDTDIIVYAEEHEMVVFTGDQRFLHDDDSDETPPPKIDADCGVIFYKQEQVPSEGAVVASMQQIAAEYPDYSIIREYVPR